MIYSDVPEEIHQWLDLHIRHKATGVHSLIYLIRAAGDGFRAFEEAGRGLKHISDSITELRLAMLQEELE